MEESEDELMEIPLKNPSEKETTPAKVIPGKKAATPAKTAAWKKCATRSGAKNGKKEESRDVKEESNMPRACINKADSFCYICGGVTFASQRRNLTKMIRKAYNLYFGYRIGDQGKSWAPHICCNRCASHLTQWLHGKRQAMPFAVPMIWREPTDHSTNCYFCMVPPIRKGVSRKKKWTLQYPNIPSATRPVPHTVELPVPKAPETFSDGSSEEEEGAWCHEAFSSHDPDSLSATSTETHLITQSELNDLVRDLDLPKSKVELLGSRLQQWNLLAGDVDSSLNKFFK
ncbi:uncharacterized protein ACNLHF_014021 [Anomaloglossus baeobatrachus]|uniref:uncharacterized protein LOC142297261 n=1 Tax=Anomaloglossus baeobatrachus TaxID=238106 RepID=UPI003F4FF2FA